MSKSTQACSLLCESDFLLFLEQLAQLSSIYSVEELSLNYIVEHSEGYQGAILSLDNPRTIICREGLKNFHWKDVEGKKIDQNPLLLDNKKVWIVQVNHNFSHFLYLKKENEKFSQKEIHTLKAVCKILDMCMEKIFLKTLIPPEKHQKEETSSDKIEQEFFRQDLNFLYEEIIGESQSILAILKKMDRIVKSNVPVLIEGESGTGKELIARALHQYGSRCKQKFVSENCAAITETLLESELFGYVKGAFTGADKDKIGLFELAHKGSIFLDEVGDMSSGMQKKLLRTLQHGELRPVGGKKVKKVDVRVIAATNKNLQEEVRAKRFRDDLFYRLNVITIKLPPLRERGKDILLLLDYFNEKISLEMGMEIKKVSKNVKKAFLNYHWPGNIRELENEIQRMIALADDEISEDLLSLS